MSAGGATRRKRDEVVDVEVINVKRDAAKRNGEIRGSPDTRG
jgi:hypothetical protein